jgi:lipoate---protein ligase
MFLQRNFASTVRHALSPTHSIYVSESTNPYFNLALEDWFVSFLPNVRQLEAKMSKAVQAQTAQRAAAAALPRCTLRSHRKKSKSVERSESPFIAKGGNSFHSQAFRRRDRVSCAWICSLLIIRPLKLPKDLGNTNFSIHLPRTSFDRNETGQVVLSAVRSLGITAARLNDRNDLCVGPHKVSGSAYKIVNKRAYHHGTMLISTQLDTLGNLLRTSKVSDNARAYFIYNYIK